MRREGHFDLALTAVAEGIAVAEQTEERWFDAELYRLRGEFTLRAVNDELNAEQHFERAIQIAQQQQAKSWELRATMSLAKLWARRGRAAEARERLMTIYDWFSEGFGTPDLKEARALLDAM